MKLKILPPTLRKNSRYLALDIKSETKINKDELILSIWDGCIRFYGECETSNFNLWLMKTYEFIPETESFNDIQTRNKLLKLDSKDNIGSNVDLLPNNINNISKNKNLSSLDSDRYYFYQKAILRCQRNYEDKVRGSLASMSNYRGKRISIATVGISGTIASLITKFIN